MKSAYRTFLPHKGSKPTSKKAKEVKFPRGKVTIQVRIDPDVAQALQELDLEKSIALNAQELLTDFVRGYGT